MQSSRRGFIATAAIAALGRAQDESFEIYREPPRLFLTGQRLRRLRRDRERQAPRWEQFHRLVTGGASFPEPGFALGLYAHITGDRDFARQAISWAATAGDARQIAFVYDWCQPASESLAPHLEEARRRTRDPRAKALAAIALGDDAALASVVKEWWRGQIVPALSAGRDAVPRGDLYFLCEVMHAVRDNTSIEMRDSLPAWFRDLPRMLLGGYYPAIFPAPENDYRVPATKGAAVDLKVSALARAAELALVAYDTNLEENQYLQGWAMHDRFMLRDPFGAPYEVLWANPYQPGLSYDLLPTVAYDQRSGQLFARSGWEDGAEWIGWLPGELQTFSDGHARVVPLSQARKIYAFGDAAIVPVQREGRIEIGAETKTIYLVGVERSAPYRIEPDRHGVDEVRSDPGGVIRLEFPSGFRGGVTVKRRSA